VNMPAPITPAKTVVVCAQLESDLADLSPEEAQEYLKELGVKESGVAALIQSTYHVLGLRTFFTFNDKEVRAWTVHAGATAVKAAGTVTPISSAGSSRRRRFIGRSWSSRVQWATRAKADITASKAAIMSCRDGDVLLFKFNV